MDRAEKLYCPFCGADAKIVEQVDRIAQDDLDVLGFCAVHKAFVVQTGSTAEEWFNDDERGQGEIDGEEDEDS